MNFNLIQPIVYGLLRALLASLGGLLVSRGIMDEGTATGFVGGLLVLAMVMISSVWSKFTAQQREEVALEMPAGSSQEKLNDVIATK